MTRVKNVAILGGGTAGWMTAAALITTFGKDVSVSLIESDALGTVGVGEATIPTIHWFNNLVGLEEGEFLRTTKASFKLGIEFVDWGRLGDRYFHPFGRFGIDRGNVPFHQRWLRGLSDGLNRPISSFSLAAKLASAGRFAKPVDDPNSILSTLGYAYHFDAALYAKLLRRISEERGVKRYEGRLSRVERDAETGFVTALTTDRGERLAAELFVDCSGFRAILIGHELNSAFEDWSQWLPCDSAVAVPCAGEATIAPFTRSTRRSAGWQWRIPLQHRIGNGYVYSSNYISDDDATRTVLGSLDGEPLAAPKLLRFRTGFRRQAWKANVVAIGLAAGFLEPLESTSIHLIQSGIAKLLALFPDQDCDVILQQRFNTLIGQDMGGIRDFLVLHYRMTSDNDAPFWRDLNSQPLPAALSERIEQYRRSGRLMLDDSELFREASWLAVLNGQGVEASGTTPLADTLDAKENIHFLKRLEDVILAAEERLPLHEAAISLALAQKTVCPSSAVAS